MVSRITRGYGAWADREDIPYIPIYRMTDSIIQRIKLARKSVIFPNASANQAAQDNVGTDFIGNWLVVPIIAGDKLVGWVELGKAGNGLFSPEQGQWAEALVGPAAIAIQNAWLFDQLRSSSEMLHSLAHKLVNIQEKERYSIARELHDEAGQSLSSLKLSLSRLEQDQDCPPRIQGRLQELKNVADNVLEDIHRLAMALRPAVLDHLGLIAALEQLASNLKSERLSIHIKAVGFDGQRLPPDVETSLYRIVQEGLTNVVRHARASDVGILLEKDADKVKLFVEDNGVGFEQNPIEENMRIGLIGMRERAEMLGGKLTIESSPGKGTSIIVEVPDGNSNFARG